MDTEAPRHPSLPTLLRHARRTYGEAMRAALANEGLDDIPASGLYVIGMLALEDGGVPISRLVRELTISKQGAGQLVDTLVTRGYLVRKPDPVDRRQLIVSLTPRGRTATAIQTTARESVDAALRSVVGQAEFDRTLATLGVLVELGWEGFKHADNQEGGAMSESLKFDDRSLNDATFQNCSMSRSHFEDVKLAEAQFENVDLQRATFRNVNMKNVSIEDANIAGLTINGHDIAALIRLHEEGTR